MKLTDGRTGACICLLCANIDLFVHIPVDGIWTKDLRFYEVVSDVHHFHGTELLLQNLHSFGWSKCFLSVTEPKRNCLCTVFNPANCACNRS